MEFISMKDAINCKGNCTKWKDRTADRDTLLRDLAAIIKMLVPVAVGTATSTNEFKAQNSKAKTAFLKNPIYACIEGCIRTALTAIPKEQVQLCLDNSEEYALECLRIYHKLRKHDPEFKRRCTLIAFGEDEKLPGLQVADMIAYCERSRLSPNTSPPIVGELLRLLSPTEPKIGSLSYSGGRSIGEGFFALSFLVAWLLGRSVEVIHRYPLGSHRRPLQGPSQINQRHNRGNQHKRHHYPRRRLRKRQTRF